MRQKSGTRETSSKRIVRNIRRATRKRYSAEENIRIVLDGLRAAAPKASDWARVEFATLRLKLIKIAARVIETTARIRVSLPSACPDRTTFALIVHELRAQPPWPTGQRAAPSPAASTPSP